MTVRWIYNAHMPKDRTRSITSHHAIEESLRAGHDGTLYVIASREWGTRLASLARSWGVRVVESSRADLRSRGGEAARDAVFVPAEAATPLQGGLAEYLAGPLSDSAVVLVLDHITDPQNLGALLRSADQFGVDICVRASRRAAPMTDAVARASAGASAHVWLATVANINTSIEQLRSAGFWVYGAHMEGEPAHTVKLQGRVAVVLGSEGTGLSRLTADRVDQLVSIPARGHVDSFNVSVAGGILLYEVRRQQGRL
jgi:23S rRNA (guanosine2251-2'-O)-methyltransferase